MDKETIQLKSSITQEDFSYEKDSRFVEFLKLRIEASHDQSRLIDGHEATRQISENLGFRTND